MIDENNIEDFEQFLKSQTDKHRMYPGDQIWRNINQQLHGNSRWPALTFAAFLTGALLTAGLIFLHPDKDLFKLPVVATSEATRINKNIAGNKTIADKPAIADITTLKPADEKAVMYTFNNPAINTDKGDEYTSNNRTIAAAPAEAASISNPNKNDIAVNSSINANNISDNDIQPAAELLKAAPRLSIATNADNSISDDDFVASSDSKATITTGQNDVTTAFENVEPAAPMFTNETVTSNKKKTTNRFTVKVYGGSNISYRLLSEPASDDYHFPYNAPLTADPRKNVNNYVSQRPSVGFEFGTAIAFALNDRFKVKAGLQFNLRQYNIDAFRASQAPAVLLLSNNAATDSVIVYSSIRNAEGNKPVTLQNHYYQIGLPIGIDWTFAEGRKVNFSLGATIQPTYQLNTNIYMITSDYKGYVQQPDMVRRWNMNAGAEAMANFNAGGLQWQIGPQVRYQMQPTQSKSYSIHEHLIDYGVKFGIIKQIK